MSHNQCKATILRLNRRCKLKETTSGYCQYHGPLCEAKKKNGYPCRSMVLKFRLGYIYCDCHESISMGQHSGPHDAEFEELLQDFNSLRFKSLTTTKTTTTTTTTTTTRCLF